MPGIDIDGTLTRARALAAEAEDEAAKGAYLDILRADPTHLFALNELGTLALSGGFRSAARTAYQQAVRHHLGNKIVRVNLANLLREEHDPAAAREHYEAALAVDPGFPEAHQGMAWVLNELGLDGAHEHRQKGFIGHAIVGKPYRGSGIGVPLLMLVSARGGNIPTQLWITDRHFAVSAIYTEFHDPGMPLPPHALIVNAIGDADLDDAALRRAEELTARSAAPVINPPARVRLTGRAENARRLAALEGVTAPKIRASSPPPYSTRAISTSRCCCGDRVSIPVNISSTWRIAASWRPRSNHWPRRNCSSSNIWTRAVRTAWPANTG